MTTIRHLVLFFALVFGLVESAQAQFTYVTNGSDIILTTYANDGEPVNIPNYVTEIGTNAFANSDFGYIITIPDNVLDIDDGAFSNCFGLNIVSIGSGVTNIGASAFWGCEGLAEVNIGNSVKSIGAYAFYGCLSPGNEFFGIGASGLATIIIPDSVGSIGAYAFAECGFLNSVTIGSGVTNICSNAFYDCSFFDPNAGYSYSLSEVNFRGNAPSLGANAFTGENPTFFILPGTTGWEATGLQTMPWNPQIQIGGSSFGVQHNQFGFNVICTNTFTFVVQACTNVANPVWVPLQTNTVSGIYYFADRDWTNYPSRYYSLALP